LGLPRAVRYIALVIRRFPDLELVALRVFIAAAAALAWSSFTPVHASAQVATLALALIDSADPIAPGGDLVYTATLANQSVADAATNITLTLTLPPEVGFVSLAAPGLVCLTPAIGMSGAIECTVAILTPMASATLSLRVTTPELPARLVLRGEARADGSGGTRVEAVSSEETVVGESTELDASTPPGGGDGEDAGTGGSGGGFRPIPTPGGSVGGPHTEGGCTCTAALGARDGDSGAAPLVAALFALGVALRSRRSRAGGARRRTR
jgi:uncharacterized repeat protein (TIGR01451 family)